MSRISAFLKILIFISGLLLIPTRNEAQVIEFTSRILNAYSQTAISGANIQVLDKYTSETLFHETTRDDGSFSIRVPASERIFIRIEADACETKDLSYRELSAMHLEEKRDILLAPSITNGHYSYELILPDRSGAFTYGLTISNEEGKVIYQGTINTRNFTLPITLKRGMSYHLELKNRDILTRSWSISWKGGSEPDVSYLFSLNQDAVTLDKKKGGLPLLKHTVGIIQRKIDFTYEIQGLEYEVAESFISAKSGLAMDEVIRIVRANPDVLFELGNHSKDFGDRSADLNLSQVRAHIAVDYLTEKANIPADQIAPRGYGNVQMSNGCPGRLKCRDVKIFKDHEHTRTILKIIGFKDRTVPHSIPRSTTEKPQPEVNGMGALKFDADRSAVELDGNKPSKGKNYTGQAVQILVVKEPLPKEHVLLSDQRIIMSERPQKGYAYIAVPETGSESVGDLLNMYRENYKDAFVVNLKDGKRIQ